MAEYIYSIYTMIYDMMIICHFYFWSCWLCFLHYNIKVEIEWGAQIPPKYYWRFSKWWSWVI